jgi:hypothetical protein
MGLINSPEVDKWLTIASGFQFSCLLASDLPAPSCINGGVITFGGNEQKEIGTGG